MFLLTCKVLKEESSIAFSYFDKKHEGVNSMEWHDTLQQPFALLLPVRIYYDKRFLIVCAWVLFLLCLGAVGFWIASVVYPLSLFLHGNVQDFFLAIGLIIAAVLLPVVLFCCWLAWNMLYPLGKTDPLIIFRSEGVQLEAYPFQFVVGFFPWEQVRSIALQEKRGKTFLCLFLYEQNQVLARLNWLQLAVRGSRLTGDPASVFPVFLLRSERPIYEIVEHLRSEYTHEA